MTVFVVLAPKGQVGFELVRALSPLGKVVAIGRQDIDFSNLSALADMITNLNPDVIVNAAAYTMVDKAETDQVQAFLLNEHLPLVLAKIADKQNALLVHYSTDYVYSGHGEKPWLESDETSPLSIYGKSKLAGDVAIMTHCKNYLIFRTSWVYASRGNNFMKTMMKLAQDREVLKVVGDQFGAPTPARLIAQTSALAIQCVLRDNSIAKLSGVYHLAAAGYTSWCGFANEIFALARKANISLALKSEKLFAISTEEYPTPAKRPKNSRLDVSKIENSFGLVMPNWQSQLQLTFLEWLEYQK